MASCDAPAVASEILVALIAALSALAGAIVNSLLTARLQDRQREHDLLLQQREREHDLSTRFLDDRRALYARILSWASRLYLTGSYDERARLEYELREDRYSLYFIVPDATRRAAERLLDAAARGDAKEYTDRRYEYIQSARRDLAGD